MVEIERKFLVNSNAFKKEAFKSTRIIQGFLNTDKERTVRVRLKGDKGFITVKGKSNNSGLSRFEWEKEISKTDVESLLKLCEKGIIDKIRYEVKVGKHIFEVDEFCLNSPLIFVVILRFCGLGTSSAVVIHGPHGAKVSNPFARVNCLS